MRKIVFKQLLDKINKYDDILIGKIINYPSRGIISLAFMISFLASAYAFSIYSLVWGFGIVITIYEIPFLIIFYTFPIIAVFIYCYKIIYKSIKYYEQTHGKTGLGDEYIERWNGAK